MKKLILPILIGCSISVYANNDIKLSKNETLIQLLEIDLDSDGDKDRLVITKNTSDKNHGYLLTILNANKLKKLVKSGTNKHIFQCAKCIRTEQILYIDNLDTTKPNQFSLHIENMGNNATFTFKKNHNEKWYLIDFESNYIKSNGKWITKRKSYPKDYGLIYFDKFNPDLLY